jgi:hypothetical protein
MTTKEKLEYEDFGGLTEWEKGSTCGKSNLSGMNWVLQEIYTRTNF